MVGVSIARKQQDLALKSKAKTYQQRIGGLFPIVCHREWMMQAMWNILHNRGAESSGVDGKTRSLYYDAKTRSLTSNAMERIENICQSLEEGRYSPQPVRRIYIPKANGKMRPIGIPTLDDRTVQEAVRLAIEPVYESKFLNCSYGFRPNRCAMDAISVCYRLIGPQKKYYWVIEGDIKGCFDSIDHRILLRLLRNNIADRKLIAVIHGFLKMGYQENGRICKPKVGTPQGGIISPLLANIYLHELDKWWSENYDLDTYHKRIRRDEHLGNFILVRYADDFIILSNATKKATESMKERVAEFLRDELKLDLSQEKTAVTHITAGIDFLGFNVRRYENPRGTIIRPTRSSVQRIKDKIARHLDRRTRNYAVRDVMGTLNPVIRGWTNYYRFVNSFAIFHELDFYLARKFLKWYRGKYQLPRKKGAFMGLEWLDREKPFHLYRFTETKVERYKWERKSNPYIEMRARRVTDNPFLEVRWYGKAKRDADLRWQCFQRDKGVCQICLRPKTNIESHHMIPLSENGEDILDNLVTLCHDCHKKYKWQEIRRLVESRVPANRHARFGEEEGRNTLV